MQRAKLRGLKRDAAVVLGNVGAADDAAVLTTALDEDADQMVGEHAAWALARVRLDAPLQQHASAHVRGNGAENR